MPRRFGRTTWDESHYAARDEAIAVDYQFSELAPEARVEILVGRYVGS